MKSRNGVALAALALGSLLAAGACSGESDPGRGGFKVALLLAGPENDEGWNQSAFEGLALIERQLGADVRKVRASTAVQIEQALSEAAQQGFALVFGHGFEFNAPAARVAAAWPEVKFATSGGTASAPNLATVVLRTEEAA